MWTCTLCSISVSSDYSKQQHLAGAKHAARLEGFRTPSRSGSGLPCFAFARGSCRRDNCAYSHERPTSSVPARVEVGALSGSLAVAPPSCSDGTSRGGTRLFGRGSCNSGGNCRSSHELASSAIAPSGALRMPSPSSSDQTLATGGEGGEVPTVAETARRMESNVASDEGGDMSMGAGLAASKMPESADIVSGKFLLRKLDIATPLPSQYRDALKRKRDVGICIRDGKVILQFAYNALVIKAVKEHIRGRRWEPNMEDKGRWTCPLESLPDVVALWEHMGRGSDVDSDVKQRAKKVQESCGGASSMQLTFRLFSKAVDNDSWGMVDVAFQYEPTLVAAIKQVAPSLRSYNPVSKSWSVELLALPVLMSHVAPLGYVPVEEVLQIVETCMRIDFLLHPLVEATGSQDPHEEQSLKKTTQEAEPVLTGTGEPLRSSFSDMAAVAIIEPVVQASTAIPAAGKVRRRLVGKQPPPDTAPVVTTNVEVSNDPGSVGGDAVECSPRTSDLRAGARCTDVPIETAAFAASDQGRPISTLAVAPAAAVQNADRTQGLEMQLLRLVQLVRQSAAGSQVDRSDCGTAKRRRLTTQQLEWQEVTNKPSKPTPTLLRGACATKLNQKNWSQSDLGADSSDDDVISDTLFGFDIRAVMGRFSNPRSLPLDCDCGHPYRLVGGRHCCRYFGTFHCHSCGNRWTSAYCWKGERQACRRCDEESFPVKKDQLDGRAPSGTGGAHDTDRCSQCHKLGFDCSSLSRGGSFLGGS